MFGKKSLPAENASFVTVTRVYTKFSQNWENQQVASRYTYTTLL